MAFFNHLLRVVPANGSLFEKKKVLFSTKTSENTYSLWECSIVNALNAEKEGVKIHCDDNFRT